MAPSLAANLTRLDDLQLQERCAVDAVAEALSLSLFATHYDQLPAADRCQVEGAALRAVRSQQQPWRDAALARACEAVERAMRSELGAAFAQQSDTRRKVLTAIVVQTVATAFLSVLELSHPFDGPGEALAVYAAIDTTQEVRDGR